MLRYLLLGSIAAISVATGAVLAGPEMPMATDYLALSCIAAGLLVAGLARRHGRESN